MVPGLSQNKVWKDVKIVHFYDNVHIIVLPGLNWITQISQNIVMIITSARPAENAGKSWYEICDSEPG